MEFKTLEQYFLAEMEDLKNHNAELESTVTEQGDEISLYQHREILYQQLLNKLGFHISTTATGALKIETGNVYGWEEKFESTMKIIKELGLEDTYTNK